MALQGNRIAYMELDGVPQTLSNDTDDDSLTHMWCDCKGPDVGLCGANLEDSIEVECQDPSNECIVCYELDKLHESYYCSWGGGL